MGSLFSKRLTKLEAQASAERSTKSPSLGISASSSSEEGVTFKPVHQKIGSIQSPSQPLRGGTGLVREQSIQVACGLQGKVSTSISGTIHGFYSHCTLSLARSQDISPSVKGCSDGWFRECLMFACCSLRFRLRSMCFDRSRRASIYIQR